MRKSKFHLVEALGHEPADKRIDILRRIGEAGSISQAARAAGVSYKAAWQALETLSNLAGTPLVTRAVGGSGGGGAMLTEAGERVLRAADLLRKSRAEVLTRLDADAAAGSGLPGIAGLTLQTSMRNQLPCTIEQLKPVGASVRVQLALADGVFLYSRITRESVQLLGLRPGKPALALCKATAVAVAKRIAPKGGRNLLYGKVTRASHARTGGEVGLQLADGLRLVGFGKPGHGLKAGAAAMAAVEELGVVIAVSE